jgi:hypothetical protein
MPVLRHESSHFSSSLMCAWSVPLLSALTVCNGCILMYTNAYTHVSHAYVDPTSRFSSLSKYILVNTHTHIHSYTHTHIGASQRKNVNDMFNTDPGAMKDGYAPF